MVLYKHSFRARKVVQTMDLREREKRKELLLGLDTLSKKKKEKSHV